MVPSIDYIIEGLDGQQQGNPSRLVVHQTNLNMVVQFCLVYDAMFEPTFSPPRVTGDDLGEVDSIECGFIEVTIH